MYNLGTMFYVDKILFANKESLPATNSIITTTEKTTTLPEITTEDIETDIDEVEGSMPDVLFADAEATTGKMQTHQEDLKSTTSQNATVK